MSIAQPFLTPFLESVGNAGLAGVLALRRSGLQLRVSAGLQPHIAVTGFAIMPHPSGGKGTLSAYSIQFDFVIIDQGSPISQVLIVIGVPEFYIS